MSILSAWRLPGPLAFLDELIQGCEDGASFVIGGAGRLPAGLWVEFCERCSERGIWGRRERLDLGDLGSAAGIEPGAVLAQEWAQKPSCCGSELAALLDPVEGLEAGIYWLEGLGSAEAEAWAGFLAGFTHAVRAIMPERRPRLMLLMTEVPPALRPDVALRRRDWKPDVTPLDVALLAASQIEVRRSGAGALAARELKVQLVAELAGQDLERVDRLARAPLAELLAMGQGEQRRAVWRAQLRVLFPLIEERRLAIIEAYADLWSLPHQDREGRRIDDPLELEVGHLLFQLRGHDREGLTMELKRLKLWRDRLAHLKPLALYELDVPATRSLLDLDACG